MTKQKETEYIPSRRGGVGSGDSTTTTGSFPLGLLLGLRVSKQFVARPGRAEDRQRHSSRVGELIQDSPLQVDGKAVVFLEKDLVFFDFVLDLRPGGG